MSAPQRPKYRSIALTPALRYFDCSSMRAVLSTRACAAQWQAAKAGSACHGCPVGRLHDGDHPDAPSAQRQHDESTCLRCGRVGLRLIRQTGVCVSCAAREAEWRAGRNSRGNAPVRFTPLHEHEVAVVALDGRVRRRVVQALDAAEALGRVVRDLPTGARVHVGERRRTAWNASAGRFEHVCSECGTAGLVLERRRGSVLERHAWCCGGDPAGDGWEVAQVRLQPMAMPAHVMADWLTASEDSAGAVWTATGAVCSACHRGQLEGLLTAPGGRWRVRCRGCGAAG